MSSAADRLQEIRTNYDSAKDHEAGDLARATTNEQVAAIQANVAAARLTFYRAIAAQLQANGDNVEAAFQAAKAANSAVATARTNSEQIATLLGKLTKATSTATDLLDKAKGLVDA